MKIQCQSCQAKYTIADEKVLGKVVKIRCKKCSATIVINGNEQQPADAGGGGAFDYAQGGEQWTVNVADGDQRTMTVGEITTEYKNGVVNDETYCWKDGMADWLPLREVDQIYSAIKAGEVSVAPEPAPAAAPLFAGSSSGGDSPFAGGAGRANGNGAALFAGGGAAAEQHAPAAARRAGGRAQGTDLFGNVEKAGGEDDVMTSAANAAIAANAAAAQAVPSAEEKLTGQRNENSVLFSLNALTEKKETKPTENRTTATSDGSGLIDIRALSANMDEDKKTEKPRVDDIMNLSGGGAFGAALAAPILAPPPLEPVDLGVVATDSPQPQNKTLIFAILGGCAFIAVGIIVAVVLTRSPAPEEKKADTTGAGSAAAAGSMAAPTPTDSSASGATSVAANDTPPPPGTGQAGKPGTVNPGKPSGTKPAGGAAAAGGDHAGGGAPAPPGPAAAPAAPEKPKDLASAMGEAAGVKENKPAGGGGGSTAPFDRGAAAAALGAVNVSSCKKGDGPSGAGHVTVTFGPDGQVQTAVVDQGPFPGTAVGGCIAGKFRGAHVPPFGGAPVRVGKSFTIQ